jgi:hypothetical protein
MNDPKAIWDTLAADERIILSAFCRDAEAAQEYTIECWSVVRDLIGSGLLDSDCGWLEPTDLGQKVFEASPQGQPTYPSFVQMQTILGMIADLNR